MPSSQQLSTTPEKERDRWRTPPWLFQWAAKRYRFCWDLAAEEGNALCDAFITREQDSLAMLWSDLPSRSPEHLNGFGWCNPPYSNVAPWVEKAHRSAWDNFSSVLLVPTFNGDRYWGDHVFGCVETIIWIVGRVAFLRPDGEEVKGNRGGSALLVYTPTGCRTKADKHVYAWRDDMHRDGRDMWTRPGTFYPEPAPP